MTINQLTITILAGYGLINLIIGIGGLYFLLTMPDDEGDFTHD